MSDVPEGEAPASSETDSELVGGVAPCLSCPPRNKHVTHTCGKARSAKKRCKQSAPPEAVHDDESDDARDKARGKAKAKDKAKDKEKGDSKADSGYSEGHHVEAFRQAFCQACCQNVVLCCRSRQQHYYMLPSPTKN